MNMNTAAINNALTTETTHEKTGYCYCGCGKQVKGWYAQGHDAAHVSIRLAELERELDEYGVREDFIEAETVSGLEALATPALRRKFAAAARRLIDRELRRLAREVAREDKQSEDGMPDWAISESVSLGYTTGHVKIGRWTYPTREYTDRSRERNTKRDGSGEWIDCPPRA